MVLVRTTSVAVPWFRSATTSIVGTAFPTAVSLPPVDPTVLVDLSMLVRGTGAFVLVLAVGGLFLFTAEDFVDRSVDASMATPLRSVAYGVLAQIVLVGLGLYAVSQLSGVAAIGSGGQVVLAVGSWALALAWSVLVGFGFAVVGAGLTDATGSRQLWSGLAIGAAVAAFVWVIPTVLVATLVWVLIASIGIGGPTRRWVYASVEGDVQPEV